MAKHMEFEDQNIVVASPLGDIHVNVSAAALSVLWGEDVGAQDEAGLIEANRRLLDSIVLRKLELGVAEGLIVTIADFDIEEALDATEVGS